MSDEFAADTSPRDRAPAIAQRRGCLVSLIGSLLTIVISAALGALLAVLFLWYGPRNVGFTLPDSTGRLAELEHVQRTAVVERAEMRTTLDGLSDLRGAFNTLRDEVQGLETEVTSRETNLDELRSQIKANFESLLALQGRIDELESIPANAALANRLAEAELQLATVGATLDRLRLALGAPPAAANDRSPTETAIPEVTGTPEAESEAGATPAQ